MLIVQIQTETSAVEGEKVNNLLVKGRYCSGLTFWSVEASCIEGVI